MTTFKDMDAFYEWFDNGAKVISDDEIVIIGDKHYVVGDLVVDADDLAYEWEVE